VPQLARTKPLLCIVTDRRRLAKATGRTTANPCDLLLRQIEGAVGAGIHLVQIREPDLDLRQLLHLAREAVRIAGGSATSIVVNDRLDVALATGAAGVHLRERSFAAAEVRRIAPQMLVGRSVHSEPVVQTLGPVDYLVAGTVFRTASKVGAAPIGVAGLERIVKAAGNTPVLAIGGIDELVAATIAAAGAAGVAAIGAFLPQREGQDIAQAVRTCANDMRSAFHGDAAAR
jgi:thiamine-phosphate pyrophosphorylase